jgi:imidazole glycerol-phosphate synthase subunit HisH
VITIVDYGLGNVQAIANIYKRLEIPTRLARTVDDLKGATHLILPGVGAFDWAMSRLNDSGMRSTLDDLVLQRGRPVLGICDARVRLFDDAKFVGRTHLPHMGWNDVEAVRTDGLLRDLGEGARFYFLHSYYFAPNVPADVLARTDYGGRFVCAAQRGNVHGVQFHPEKSHGWGIQLLKNFAAL